jgi:hypothetical protein
MQADQSSPALLGTRVYKTEHNAVGRFPEPGNEELLAGPSRNFQAGEAGSVFGDHSGTVIGERVGIVLMTAPADFRASCGTIAATV